MYCEPDKFKSEFVLWWCVSLIMSVVITGGLGMTYRTFECSSGVGFRVFSDELDCWLVAELELVLLDDTEDR